MPVPEQDRTVADAINRVLEVERAASAAIVEAELTAKVTIEAAREARRRILERARQRVMRMHERAEVRLATRLAQLDATAAADEHRARLSPDEADAVLAIVATRLTTDGST
jgi:vacuolar-type H+-ATPase subunit H